MSSQQTSIQRWVEAFAQPTSNEEDARHRSGSIPDAELISSLQSLAEELGERPSMVQMNQYGPFDSKTYQRRFGSWVEALSRAGLDINTVSGRTHWNYDIGQLVDEMLRVAELVDRPPFQRDIEEHAKYSHSPYLKAFGSWSEALQMCGLPPRKRGQVASYSEREHNGYGNNWDEQRSKALERDRFRCQACGIRNDDHKEQDPQSRGLEVHHIVPLRKFDRPENGNILENLISLCRGCHQFWEGYTGDDIAVDELVQEVRQ